MMLSPQSAQLASWSIAGAATVGVIARPFDWPEAVWALSGAALLVLLGLLPWSLAWSAVRKGGDVYLFLVGMMLLSETARRQGLFDWVAVRAVNLARRSPRRLFLVVYAAGVLVTAFMSNDATAVALTPAVYAAARKARVEPLPYLFICALVANAASFVLPISNPANIVLYGDHTPALLPWLKSFALPSVLSIVATYLALRFTEGRRLPAECESDLPVQPLSRGARAAMVGLALTAVVLLVTSALDRQLGLPTAIMGVATTALVLAMARESPWATVREVSWAVLPLVAGFFVLVEALARTGVIDQLARLLADGIAQVPARIPWISGGAIALGSNFINNLPAGLIASSTVAIKPPAQSVVDALLIGVDLGPNLSVTGSLATILWLTAVRREGEDVSVARFLRLGVIAMPPALILALAGRLIL